MKKHRSVAPEYGVYYKWEKKDLLDLLRFTISENNKWADDFAELLKSIPELQTKARTEFLRSFTLAQRVENMQKRLGESFDSKRSLGVGLYGTLQRAVYYSLDSDYRSSDPQAIEDAVVVLDQFKEFSPDNESITLIDAKVRNKSLNLKTVIGAKVRAHFDFNGIITK